MADVSFDDLIPKKAAPASTAAVNFDDLVPKKPAISQSDPSQSNPATAFGAIGQEADPQPEDVPGNDAGPLPSMYKGAVFGFPGAIRAASAVRSGYDSLVNGSNYDDHYNYYVNAHNKIRDQNIEDHPIAARVGAAIPQGVALAAALSAAGIAAPVAGAGYAANAAFGAGTGAALGAVNGLSDTPDLTDLPQAAKDTATGAAFGSVAGAGGSVLGKALSSGVGAIAGRYNTKPVIPDGEALRQASQAAYKASENAGVIVNGAATQRLADALKQRMTDFGYSPYMQPKAQGVIAEMDRAMGNNATLKGLDTIRKVTGRLGEGEPSEAALGRQLTGEIDNFTNNLLPSDIVAGNAPQGVASLNEARGLWQKVAKSDDLESALTHAKNLAASTGSGGNIQNATRSAVRKLLESRNNWTSDETAALQSVISGTPTQNTLRLIGKLSPEGNGLMMALHAGNMYATGANPGALGLALGGALAKRSSDGMAASGASRLGELIRAGGTNAAVNGPMNPVQQLAYSQQGALARALSSGGASAIRYQPEQSPTPQR